MPHCDPCKHGSGPLECYAATRPRLCELIHVLHRTDYEALINDLTANPPPPWTPPEDFDADQGFDFGQPAMTTDGSPNPWQAARVARNACEHYKRSCTGCDGGECARPDKAGPTDLARCAECLGMPLPVKAGPDGGPPPGVHPDR